MIMEGFSEKEEDTPDLLNKRGLFALPKELLTESRGFREPIRRRIIAFAASPRAHRFLPILCFSFVFLAVWFAVFLYLIPAESKAVREGPIEEEPSISEPEASSMAGLSEPTALIPGNPIVSAERVDEPSTSLELVFLRVLQWLGFTSQHHDEEAMGRRNGPERWTKFLLPRFLDTAQAT